MRIAAALCLISAVVLAGCSSARGARVTSQPRATYAAAPMADAAPSRTVHERRVTSFTPPGAPDIPSNDLTFVPAARPASAKSMGLSAGASVSGVADPCDPCALPAQKQCCPPRFPNPFKRAKCCPPSG